MIIIMIIIIIKLVHAIVLACWVLKGALDQRADPV